MGEDRITMRALSTSEVTVWGLRCGAGFEGLEVCCLELLYDWSKIECGGSLIAALHNDKLSSQEGHDPRWKVRLRLRPSELALSPRFQV